MPVWSQKEVEALVRTKVKAAVDEERERCADILCKTTDEMMEERKLAIKAAVDEERARCIEAIERLRSFGDEGNGLLRAIVLLDGMHRPVPRLGEGLI